MSISKQIKEAGLPSAKFVYDRAGISRDLFYTWLKNRPAIIDLVVKGCLYEKRDDE
jgi:hypothetical protein